MTDDRAKLHKNTHDWTRKRYRELIQGGVNGHVESGERKRIVTGRTPTRVSPSRA